MFKFASAVLSILASVACSGYDADSHEEADFDDVEQEITANQGGFGYFEGNGERTSCNTTSTTQVCHVPLGPTAAGTTPKSVRYCINGSDSGSGVPNFTSQEQALIVNSLNLVDAQVSWSFVNGLGTGAGCTLRIKPAALSGAASSNNIAFFRSFSPVGLAVLSDGTTPGTWKSFQQGVCAIDLPKLKSKFPGTIDVMNALHQMVGSCAALSMGIGSKASSGGARITDVTVMASGQIPSNLSSKDVCLANSWNGNGPTAFAFNATVCS